VQRGAGFDGGCGLSEHTYFVVIAYNKHRFIVADELAYSEACKMAKSQLRQRTKKGPGPKPKALVCKVEVVA
jgi:hypothetical protein